jgi:catechol 2,3-dioxygenase-like lactoylglutathione lyase family enzyme
MAATEQLTFDHIHVISRDPKTSAQSYIDNLGATVTNEVTARGATQIVLSLAGMRFLIRGQRPGEGPTDAPGFQDFGDFSSHNQWGTDHFGLNVHGDFDAYCASLAAKGVKFTVPVKAGAGGRRISFIAAPDNVSIELLEA